MRKIHIIGTTHNMLPERKEEFELILKRFDPDQILIEVPNKDLKTVRMKKYPKEMIFAYEWASSNGKKCSGFDELIDITKSLDRSRMKEFKLFYKEFGKTDWKELNKKKYGKLIYDFLDTLVDEGKNELRRKKMLENINNLMIKNGNVLILTGCVHLRFFEKNMKNALFPFRK